MLLIPNITSDAYQKIGVKTEDGLSFDMTLWFIDNQQSWFFTINYIFQTGDTFTLGQRRLTNGMILTNYRNQLPFSLLCFSNDGGDPYKIDDFVSKDPDNLFSSRIQLYSLSTVETEEYKTAILPSS